MTTAIRESLNYLAQGQDLSKDLITNVIQELINGNLTSTQIGGLLLGLSLKGETAEEIAAFAQALRKVSLKINAPVGALDTCGTGGDRSGTFNISTTAAFVVAGAGVPVAKHGNRFSSGLCGSADVLEQLGISLATTPAENEEQLYQIGMTFLFAQTYHPAMAKVAQPRRELGIRTIFNLLGPLLNPASTPYQLLGVSNPSLLPKIARALQLLGCQRGVVVIGEDGLDEVTLTGKTQAIFIDSEKLRPFTINPENYGFKLCSLQDLQGGSPSQNRDITLGILQGEKGPKRDIVVLNAATGLYAAGKVQSIQEGIELAIESLDSGKALNVLEKLRSANSSSLAV